MSKNILIISSHPDDTCISFSGLIIKSLAKGYKVTDVCVTCGGPASNVNASVRELEHKEAMKVLGITDPIILYKGLDGELDTIPNCELTKEIDKLINLYKPEEVYCSPYSTHSDHRALAHAFLGACRLKSGWMPKLAAFGTYMFTDQLYDDNNGGKIYNPLTKEQYELKQLAFSKYESQFKPSPNPLGADGIRIMSEYYGMMCGYRYAEMYYQLRYIRSV